MEGQAGFNFIGFMTWVWQKSGKFVINVLVDILLFSKNIGRQVTDILLNR